MCVCVYVCVCVCVCVCVSVLVETITIATRLGSLHLEIGMNLDLSRGHTPSCSPLDMFDNVELAVRELA